MTNPEDDPILAWMMRPSDEALEEIEAELAGCAGQVDALLRRRAEILDLLGVKSQSALTFVKGSGRAQ